MIAIFSNDGLTEKNVYVAFHPTNRKGDAIDLFDDSTNIFKYPREIFFLHGNASALGVEDEMNVNFYVCVCHIMLFDDILFCRPYGALHIGGLHPQTVG